MLNVIPKIEVLLFEEHTNHEELFRKAAEASETPVALHLARDPDEAIRLLRAQGGGRADLVMLELGSGPSQGMQVLERIKQDRGLHQIPVVLFTPPSAPRRQVNAAYDLGAAAVFRLPAEVGQSVQVLEDVFHYWLRHVCLPQPEERGGVDCPV